MDTDPKNPQPELKLDPQGNPGHASLEGLQKQVHELRAKLEEQTNRTALEQASLWEEHLFLKKLFIGTLAALLLVNIGTLPFFTKQMLLARRQLPQQRSLNYNLRNYMAENDPALRELAAQLQAFAVSHPDFRPLLTNYQVRLPDYFPSLPSVSP